MRAVVRGLRAAFVFFTRVPMGGFPYADEESRWASGWFPVVGLAVGLASAVAWSAADGLGPWVAAATALAVAVLLTGAFHEDGLADTADALGGAAPGDRERILTILKDSRVGTYGALALVGSVVFRLALMVEMGPAAAAGIVLAHVLARVGPVWLMALLPYVSGPSSRSGSVARAGAAQAVLATLSGVAVGGVALAGGWWGAWDLIRALAAVVGVAVLCGWRFRARLGGVTGDFLGATEQLGEVAVLWALAVG